MANHRTDMITLKQLLRLHLLGKSQRSIERELQIARPTVKKYLDSFAQSGFSLPELLSLPEEDLQELFGSSRKSIPKDRLAHIAHLQSLFPAMEKQLSLPGVSRKDLWKAYISKQSDGLKYSQFCYHLQHWQKKQQVSMHFEHKAADKLFIDFTGQKLFIIDKSTGEQKTVEVFVAILGASQLTYVEALESQQRRHFIEAIENALHFFGGVTAAIVCDNLKAAVDKSCRYEPQVNRVLKDFALHYQTVILPTRAYKPKDKALVEGAVKIIYNRIFAPLRHEQFFSLQELNKAISGHLLLHNNTPLTGKNYSRQELYESMEKQHLTCLPKERYELRSFKEVTVHKNSHVWLSEDRHYYSVPYRYMGEKVKLIYTSSKVEVYQGPTRIALHKRDYRAHHYSTHKSHMPSAHNFVSEWSVDKFSRWAESIGEHTYRLITTILQKGQHPEQAYKSCLGILKQAGKVGSTRMENACKRALHYGSCSYHTVTLILEKGLDKLTPEEEPPISIPTHINIRGRTYYE